MRVVSVTQFFIKEGVEAQDDLRAWLSEDTNISKLQTLRGIGPKTADYFKILAGISTTAMDRHLFAFLAEAGLPESNSKKPKTS